MATTSKANWAGLGGAVVTVATVLIARYTGAVEAPDTSALSDAITVIFSALGGFVATWIVTYLAPANKA